MDSKITTHFSMAIAKCSNKHINESKRTLAIRATKFQLENKIRIKKIRKRHLILASNSCAFRWFYEQQKERKHHCKLMQNDLHEIYNFYFGIFFVYDTILSRKKASEKNSLMRCLFHIVRPTHMQSAATLMLTIAQSVRFRLSAHYTRAREHKFV